MGSSASCQCAGTRGRRRPWSETGGSWTLGVGRGEMEARYKEDVEQSGLAVGIIV